MASVIKNVVLIGAGGNLGRVVLHEFLSSEAFNITILSRPSSSSTFPSSVKVIRSDYSPDSLQAAFSGQDAVISMVNGAGFSEQLKLVDAAIAAGVKRFIPSEYGCNTADERIRKLVPVFVGKRKVVDYLISKENEISWTAVITGLFADLGLKTGFLGFDLASHTARIYDHGAVPATATTLSQTGKFLIEVLRQPSETANKYVYASSFTVTQADVLRSLESTSGTKWSVDEIDVKQLMQESSEKVKRGDFSGISGLILGVCYGEFEDGPYGDFTKAPQGVWNDKLGVPMEDLDEFIRSFVAK